MMTLRNGKFFKDGQPYPVEFGNEDQIKLLERAERLIKQGEQAQLDFDINEHGVVISQFLKIDCLCGYWAIFKLRDDMEGAKGKCPMCDLRYYIKVEDGEDIAYLKK